MNEQTPEAKRGPAGPKLSELADAAGVGLERRILVTLRDTLLSPGRAAQAAFDRSETHVSQLKLFFVLGGLMLSAAALFGAPLILNIETMAYEGGEDSALAYIAAHGADPEALDAALSRWLGVLIWPIIVLSSSCFVLALKLMRPSLSWWGHILIYLVATNATSLVSIPLMAARLHSLELFMILQALAYLVFYVHLLRLGASMLELRIAGLAGLLAMMLLVTIPAGLIAGVLQFGVAAIIFDLHGLSMFEMMTASQAGAQTGEP